MLNLSETGYNTMIYFDLSSTSLQKPPIVAENMIHSLSSHGNPYRGGHLPSLQASRDIFATRQALARLISASSPMDISLTNSATLSLNMAVFGLFSPGDHVLTGNWSHNAVLRPLYQAEKRGISFTIFQQTPVFSPENIEKLIKPNTKAVILSHGSNVTGALCDLLAWGDFCKEKGLLFVVDSAQTIGIVPISVEKMGIDVLCFSGHKSLFGPTGTGGIYVAPGVEISPLLFGGSGQDSFSKTQPLRMPEKLEAGTMNILGFSGLLGGLLFLEKTGIETIATKQHTLAEYCVKNLQEIPGIQIYAREEGRKSLSVVAWNLGSLDSNQVADFLWQEGEIACRGGIHCAPLLHEFYGTQGQGMVRFSFSYFNTLEEIDKAMCCIHKLSKKLL